MRPVLLVAKAGPPAAPTAATLPSPASVDEGAPGRAPVNPNLGPGRDRSESAGPPAKRVCALSAPRLVTTAPADPTAAPYDTLPASPPAAATMCFAVVWYEAVHFLSARNRPWIDSYAAYAWTEGFGCLTDRSRNGNRKVSMCFTIAWAPACSG